jgi:uncharacterized protein
MSPEERQLLNGLFDRTRGVANAPRDSEAEALIADQVRSQPYAPYLLAQAVIVQEQALKAANDKLQELQAKVEDLEQRQPGRPPAPAGSGFLSGLGSLFGASTDPQQPPQRGPAPGPWGQPAQGYGQPNYAPPPQQPQSMWGQGAPQAGGFLKGALGAAAGVAGGVLLADSIRGLFGAHNNPFGIGSGFGGGFGQPGGETIVNNYYEGGNDPGGDQAGFVGNDGYADDGSSDDPGSSDGNFDD